MASGPLFRLEDGMSEAKCPKCGSGVVWAVICLTAKLNRKCHDCGHKWFEAPNDSWRQRRTEEQLEAPEEEKDER